METGSFQRTVLVDWRPYFRLPAPLLVSCFKHYYYHHYFFFLKLKPKQEHIPIFPCLFQSRRGHNPTVANINARRSLSPPRERAIRQKTSDLLLWCLRCVPMLHNGIDSNDKHFGSRRHGKRGVFVDQKSLGSLLIPFFPFFFTLYCLLSRF